MYYDNSRKAPLKDLAKLNNKYKNIEVLVSDYHDRISNAEHDAWEDCRIVARFKDYSKALAYAKWLADFGDCWTAGVLIR